MPKSSNRPKVITIGFFLFYFKIFVSSFTQPQPSQQEIDKINEESEEKNQRRKRPGLTPGLVPGKKVMKQYLKHKS